MGTSTSDLQPPPTLCGKCGYANAADAELCAACGKHLYLFCPCGARTLRSSPRCHRCGNKLRTRRRDLEETGLGPPMPPDKAPRWVPPRQKQLFVSLLMFALTAAVLGVIVFLAGVGPADSPWDPPSVRQQYITRWHQYPKEDLLLMVGMIATVVTLALFKGRSK